MSSILISNLDSRFPGLSLHRENFAPISFKEAKKGKKAKVVFSSFFSNMNYVLSLSPLFMLRDERRKVREHKTSRKSG